MNILQVNSLEIPDVKIIRFAKFGDKRGYFAETFNVRDMQQKCPFIYDIRQTNEAFSFANTFRGLHYQPTMGKLIRLIYGRLIDFAVDVRPDSPTYMHIVGYDVQSTCEYSDWIWLPAGFAHGTWLLENSMVEYYCTDTYNTAEQRAVSIFSKDINWSLCDAKICKLFNNMNLSTLLIKDEDR